MYPQNPQRDPIEGSPEPNISPTPNTEAPSNFPQPADAWPSEQEAIGDVEPATESTASTPAASALSTDGLIRQAGPMTPASAQPLGSQARPSRHRKPFLVLAIIVAILAVLGGLGTAAYAWYENPNKVMVDSMMQLVTTKSMSFSGTGSVGAGSSAMSLTYNGATTQQQVSLHGKVTAGTGTNTVTAEGDVINDKDGTFYIKIANVKDIIASMIKNIPAEVQPSIDQAVAKVDNKWIKIPTSGATNESTSGAQACVRTALDKVQTDASYRTELTNLYDKQQFVVVKKNLGIQGMSIGYRLGIDVAKENAFVDGLKTTKLYGDIKKCDSGIDLESMKVQGDSSQLPEFELWANLLTHQPKKLTITGASSGQEAYTFTINPVLNALVKIDVPTNATDIHQLQDELSNISMLALSGSMSEQATTTANQTNAVALQKRVEAYDAENGAYPTFAQAVSATGVAALPSDIKALVVQRTAVSGSEIGLVPCKNPTVGGTISFFNESTKAVQSIQYGSC